MLHVTFFLTELPFPDLVDRNGKAISSRPFQAASFLRCQKKIMINFAL